MFCAQALCERVGMMAGGKLRCLGSSQHLKSRFGEGYVVDAKVASASDGSGEEGARKAAAVRSAVESGAGVGSVEVAESHGGRLKIRLKTPEALAGCCTPSAPKVELLPLSLWSTARAVV